MALIAELLKTKEQLSEAQQELDQLRQEYNAYRDIIESQTNNKRVRGIQDKITWYGRRELIDKAKTIKKEEWLDYYCSKVRTQERKRRREERRRQRRQRREERRRQRKALDELMERERIERSRKNKDAN